MLIISAEGGLCNRMRAIESALALFGIIGDKSRSLTIEWPMNWEANCPFEEIFTPPGERVKIRNLKHTSIAGLLLKIKSRIKVSAPIFKLLERGRILKVVTSSQIPTLRKSGYNFAELSRYRISIIGSCYWFGMEQSDFGRFSLTPSMQQRLQTEIRRIDIEKTLVGVHIRRTDNLKSIQHSPTSLFIEQMNRRLEADPNTIFYLATDSPEVKNELSTLYTDHLVTTDGELSRNSREGIRQAAIELYTLAKSREILASHWSSFSETAAAIGAIPITKCFKE